MNLSPTGASGTDPPGGGCVWPPPQLEQQERILLGEDVCDPLPHWSIRDSSCWEKTLHGVKPSAGQRAWESDSELARKTHRHLFWEIKTSSFYYPFCPCSTVFSFCSLLLWCFPSSALLISSFCIFHSTAFLMFPFLMFLFFPLQLRHPSRIFQEMLKSQCGYITFLSEWLQWIQVKTHHGSHFPYMINCFTQYRRKINYPQEPTYC